jgi:hypothetical protein
VKIVCLRFEKMETKEGSNKLLLNLSEHVSIPRFWVNVSELLKERRNASFPCFPNKNSYADQRSYRAQILLCGTHVKISNNDATDVPQEAVCVSPEQQRRPEWV